MFFRLVFVKALMATYGGALVYSLDMKDDRAVKIWDRTFKNIYCL